MKIFTKFILIIFMFFISINKNILASPGCCFWHGGEVGCSGGRTLCSDGTVSACPCDGNSSSSFYSIDDNTNNNADGENFISTIGLIFIFLCGMTILGLIINLIERNNVNRQKKKREKELIKTIEREKLIQTQKEANIEYIIETKAEKVRDYIDNIDEFEISRFTSDDLIKIIDSHNESVFYIFDIIYKKYNSSTERKIFDNICDKILENKKITLFQNKCIKYIIDNRMLDDYEFIFLKLLEKQHVKLIKYILNNCKDVDFSFNDYDDSKNLFNNLLKINDLELVKKISKQKNIFVDIDMNLLKETKNINIENKYKFLSIFSKKDKYSNIYIYELIHEDINSKDDDDIIKSINNYSKMKDFLEENGYYIVYLLIKSRNVNCIEYILKNYKNINLDKKIDESETKYKGLTPLIYACYKKSINIVEMLINYGADGNCGDENDNTPLEYACNLRNIKISKFLFEKGYRLKTEDDNYWIERAIIKKESEYLPSPYVSKIYELKSK